MSPGEQFGRIGVHDRWMEGRAGEPSEKDVKVRENIIHLLLSIPNLRGNLCTINFNLLV
jgi:hypothetical protein